MHKNENSADMSGKWPLKLPFFVLLPAATAAAKATMGSDEHAHQQREAKQPLGFATIARSFCIVKMNILATSNPYKRVE